MKRGRLIALVVVLAVIFLMGFGLWRFNKFSKSLENWDKIKTYIDGDLKGDLKKLHLLSDDEYMLCAVGVWILANIPEEDLRKLFNYNESEAAEKLLRAMRVIQVFMRWCFIRRVNQDKKYWECELMINVINLLKKVPDSATVLNETEKTVADDFCEKHKSGKAVFKTKIFGGKTTIIDNAIMKIRDAFLK